MASARSGSSAGPLTDQPAAKIARPPAASRGVTWRSVLLAIVLLPPACWWLEYTECVSEGTDMAGISYVLPAVFLLVLVFVMLCMASLLRRQWTEHERLSYPLVHLPVEMTRDEGGLFGSLSPGREGIRLFWTAVLLTLVVESLDSLAYLYPSLP